MKNYVSIGNRRGVKNQAVFVWFLIFTMMFVQSYSVISEALEEQKVTLVFTIDSNMYTVNGETHVMDVNPQIIEDRTMLPIRYAATPLGADIGWDDATRKVTVSLGDTNIELWIGQQNALINGKQVPIDAENPNVKPLIVQDRTLLPLRFVTESLGCEVQWDGVTRKATITRSVLENEPAKPEENEPDKPGENIPPVENVPIIPPILEIDSGIFSGIISGDTRGRCYCVLFFLSLYVLP